MKTIVLEREELIRTAAGEIRALVEAKPDAVLALAAGRTMEPLFAELVRLYEQGRLSLRACRVFAVTELEDVPEQRSCRAMLERCLISRTDLSPDKCSFLTAESLDGYDAAIAAAGGLDLALLGLGDNAHIGYNEPATPFSSLSHRQKLTDATRRQLAPTFGGEEQAPRFALTMGIKTLTQARRIMVLALGEEKAEPAFKMLYARTDSAVPAAFLQVPGEVEVYLDPAAAAKL